MHVPYRFAILLHLVSLLGLPKYPFCLWNGINFRLIKMAHYANKLFVFGPILVAIHIHVF